VPSHEEVLRFVYELARREGLEPAMEKQALGEERMANV